MPRKKPKDQITVGHHVVAFIDLMGQQELLRGLTEIPDDNDTEQHADLVTTLKGTYGAVTTMRKSLQKFIEGYERRSIDVQSIPKEHRKLFKELTNNPIRVHQFSDFVTAFFALRNDQGAKVPVRGIYGLLGAAATTSIVSLASGHPIRGGIEMGVNLDIKHNEIYGAALARAYALETHIANYPRVVIGSELRDYLVAISQQPGADAISAVSAMVAKQCLEVLAIDDDGYPFIDFLGEHIRSEHEDAGLQIDIVKRAYDFVLESSIKHQQSQNSKVAFKYTLLRNYMESRLPLWGIST